MHQHQMQRVFLRTLLAASAGFVMAAVVSGDVAAKRGARVAGADEVAVEGSVQGVGFDADMFACLTGSADIVLSGTFLEDYYTRSLTPGTVIDARAATFVHCSQPEPGSACVQNIYPVNLGPPAGSDGCWAGGFVWGANRLDATWSEMHSPNNGGFLFENGRFTVDGLRIYNVGDGIRPREGAEDFVIKNVWLSYIRDDCVENDHMNAGLVDDSLFDGCFVGFSARHSNTAVEGRENVWTIQNTLVRLEAMPGPPEGGALGHKGFFKWVSFSDPESRSPKLALYNNVFMAEQQGQVSDEKMGIPAGKLVDCANNVMVWLGEGPYPAELPDCFTVTTDRAVWDDAVADWLWRHGYADCTSDAECDDGNPCTDDSCDLTRGRCRHDGAPSEGATCGPGRLCCAGLCIAPACGADASCEDGNECTVEACMQPDTCQAACSVTPADDAACGVDGICCGGSCVLPGCGAGLPCDDGNVCTTDTCLDGDTCAASCSFTPVGDGSGCPGGMCCGGYCALPACTSAADCDDGDTCTTKTCVDAGTCAATCTSAWVDCGPADGCCAPGCDGSTDLDCPSCTVRPGPFKLEDSRFKWKLSNDGDETITAATIYVSWAAEFGNLKKVKLNGDIFKDDQRAGPAVILTAADFLEDRRRRQIQAGGTEELVLEFTERFKQATEDDVAVAVTFEEGCAIRWR